MASLRRFIGRSETAILVAALLLVSGSSFAAVSTLYYLPYLLSAQ